MKLIARLLSITLLIAFTTTLYAQSQQTKFNHFVASVRKEALKQGISKKTINKYLSNLKAPAPQKNTTLFQLKHQAQAVLTFNQYIHRLINRHRIKKAQEEYKKHLVLLRQVQQQYHVQPRFIIALWGLETNFGSYTGNFPIIQSLAILAFQHHRSNFYRRQLIDALIILDRHHVIPQQLKSAWDGGMGQAQFEPSSYLAYAVDFNGDGFKNIWTNLPDIFASIANFLHSNHWNGNQTWGMEVKLPQNFPVTLANVHIRYPITKWQKLGVRQLDGRPLETISGLTSILLPNGIKGPAFLAYSNFYVLMHWNNTTFESLSTGILSDYAAGYTRPVEHLITPE